MIIMTKFNVKSILSLSNMKSKKKTTTEIICLNLGLPYQIIFQDYKCTLKSNFSFFGRLYIGQQHLMFVSNMFGIVKKTAIIIETITKVEELSNDTIRIIGKCFQEVKDQEEQMIFSGFKNSNAFKIINALWKKQKLSSEVLTSNNQDETQNGDKINDLRNLDESSMQISIFNPQIVETEKQKMVELVLPCSLDQFYRFFLADNADIYPRSKHLEMKKATKIVMSPWRKNEQMKAQMRQITAQLKVKGVPWKDQAGMTQVWLLTKRTAQELNVKTITQIADIPYSSYFTCEEHMIILKEGQTKCKFICNTAIIFNKATYMKNTILTRTFNDLKEDYMLWTQNVKEALDKLKKNIEQSEKKKNKQNDLPVEFQTQVSHNSPKKAEEIKTEVNSGKYSTKVQDKIERLDFKINQLIKVTMLLIILVIGNLLTNIYTISHSPITSKPSLHPET